MVIRYASVLFLILQISLPAVSTAATPDDSDDTGSDLHELKALSFEELLDVEITSVSKRAQRRTAAAAAVSVITAEDIRRAGHTSIPEALRMVPGLQVARVDASNWAISARGFNQAFSNKLLVLIDGRTVYTPLYAGVYWDVQDLVLEDIDRIEVIRGPGGTVWGANAVNGVINIITRHAKDTHGIYATAGGGSLDRAFSAVRAGTRIGEVDVRIFGKGSEISHLESTRYGGNAQDSWWTGRAGFRADWDASEQDSFTFQGDYYKGDRSTRFGGALDTHNPVEGGNLLLRYRHTFDETSSLRAAFYYDRTERDIVSIAEERDTLDFELQYDTDVLPNLHTTFGANYRYHADRLGFETNTIVFDPARRNDHLVNGFVQAELALLDRKVVLTAGTKLEHNEYSGFEYQPSIRAAWLPTPELTFWGAVSRSVRTPSQADEDIFITVPAGPGTTITFEGSKDFRPEELIAYEVGIRRSWRERLSLDVAAFLFDYENLATTEPGPPVIAPPNVTLPNRIENQMQGLAYGFEVETRWKPLDWMEWVASYSYLELDLEPDGASQATNPRAAERSNPTHQFKLRGHFDLPHDFEIDAAVYYVDDLSSQANDLGRNVDAYWRGDLRLGWTWRERTEFALVGQNLFERRHLEFGSSSISSAYVPRSVYGRVTFRH